MQVFQCLQGADAVGSQTLEKVGGAAIATLNENSLISRCSFWERAVCFRGLPPCPPLVPPLLDSFTEQSPFCGLRLNLGEAAISLHVEKLMRQRSPKRSFSQNTRYQLGSVPKAFDKDSLCVQIPPIGS